MADLQALQELCAWASGPGKESLQGLSKSGVTLVRLGELELRLQEPSPAVSPTPSTDDDEPDALDDAIAHLEKLRRREAEQ